MTKPVESASHKGQRRPDVPKCRRLQLEALPAGEVARAPALRPMCSASQTDRPATVRCKREEALRLGDARVAPHVRSAQRGSVKWHRVGHAHAQQRSEGNAVGRPGATSVSVASADLAPRLLVGALSMSARPSPRPDDAADETTLDGQAEHIAQISQPMEHQTAARPELCRIEC
ncbi:hypothetical protein TgHK011_000255 [Trichoderma gracile]|nr:hypothetical protein TgHK011_000255 [Trichoderma gracile]